MEQVLNELMSVSQDALLDTIIRMDEHHAPLSDGSSVWFVHKGIAYQFVLAGGYLYDRTQTIH